MKYRSLICPAWEVRAFLGGLKTQFRRLVKPQPEVRPEWTGPHVNALGVWYWTAYPDRPGYSYATQDRVPPYQPGDRIRVRETWNALTPAATTEQEKPVIQINPRPAICLTVFKSTEADRAAEYHSPEFKGPWRSSATMPHWASRITLEIEEVRAQKLQSISEEDAIAEGVEIWTYGTGPYAKRGNGSVLLYRDLWNSYYARGGRGWDVNDWVFAVTTRRIET